MEPFERRNHRVENAGGSVGGWPGEGLIAPCLAVWLCPALRSAAGPAGRLRFLGSAPRGSQRRGRLEAKARAGKLRGRRVPVRSPSLLRQECEGRRPPPAEAPPPAPARGAWPGERPGRAATRGSCCDFPATIVSSARSCPQEKSHSGRCSSSSPV